MRWFVAPGPPEAIPDAGAVWRSIAARRGRVARPAGRAGAPRPRVPRAARARDDRDPRDARPRRRPALDSEPRAATAARARRCRSARHPPARCRTRSHRRRLGLGRDRAVGRGVGQRPGLAAARRSDLESAGRSARDLHLRRLAQSRAVRDAAPSRSRAARRRAAHEQDRDRVARSRRSNRSSSTPMRVGSIRIAPRGSAWPSTPSCCCAISSIGSEHGDARIGVARRLAQRRRGGPRRDRRAPRRRRRSVRRASRDVYAAVPDGGALLVASSMPVREVEWFAAPRRSACARQPGRQRHRRVGVDDARHRGGRPGPTVGLLGDLAWLHDANGLLAVARVGRDVRRDLRRCRQRRRRHLPLPCPRASLPELDELFVTPQTGRPGRARRRYGVDARRARARRKSGPRSPPPSARAGVTCWSCRPTGTPTSPATRPSGRRWPPHLDQIARAAATSAISAGHTNACGCDHITAAPRSGAWARAHAWVSAHSASGSEPATMPARPRATGPGCRRGWPRGSPPRTRRRRGSRPSRPARGHSHGRSVRAARSRRRPRRSPFTAGVGCSASARSTALESGAGGSVGRCAVRCVTDVSRIGSGSSDDDADRTSASRRHRADDESVSRLSFTDETSRSIDRRSASGDAVELFPPSVATSPRIPCVARAALASH